MPRLLEIRSYQLKPGARDAFHALIVGQAMPMLLAWGTDVVAFGPSAHAPDAYFLIRAYRDLDDLKTRQDAFYGSDAWRQGPREPILALIAQFQNTVLWASPQTIADLRAANRAAD